MTTSIDLSAARNALQSIQIEDPRVAALRELMGDVRMAMKNGASLKQIAVALAPSFDGDEKFVLRAVSELKRARGGRRKKTADKAEKADLGQPKPQRKTLTLSKPTNTQTEA